MDLGLLVIPITVSVGFLVGQQVHDKIGATVSAIVGAIVYIGGLIVFAGTPFSFPIFAFDLSSQILMGAIGALFSLFGWYIGANVDLLKKL